MAWPEGVWDTSPNKRTLADARIATANREFHAEKRKTGNLTYRSPPISDTWLTAANAIRTLARFILLPIKAREQYPLVQKCR